MIEKKCNRAANSMNKISSAVVRALTQFFYQIQFIKRYILLVHFVRHCYWTIYNSIWESRRWYLSKELHSNSIWSTIKLKIKLKINLKINFREGPKVNYKFQLYFLNFISKFLYFLFKIKKKGWSKKKFINELMKNVFWTHRNCVGGL